MSNKEVKMDESKEKGDEKPKPESAAPADPPPAEAKDTKPEV